MYSGFLEDNHEHYTNAQLAEMHGVSTRTISRWRKGYMANKTNKENGAILSPYGVYKQEVQASIQQKQSEIAREANNSTSATSESQDVIAQLSKMLVAQTEAVNNLVSTVNKLLEATVKKDEHIDKICRQVDKLVNVHPRHQMSTPRQKVSTLVSTPRHFCLPLDIWKGGLGVRYNDSIYYSTNVSFSNVSIFNSSTNGYTNVLIKEESKEKNTKKENVHLDIDRVDTNTISCREQNKSSQVLVCSELKPRLKKQSKLAKTQTYQKYPLFQQIWDTYPKRTEDAKKDCFKHFLKVLKHPEFTEERLLNAVTNYRNYFESLPDEKKPFSKGFRAFLRDELWNEEQWQHFAQYIDPKEQLRAKIDKLQHLEDVLQQLTGFSPDQRSLIELKNLLPNKPAIQAIQFEHLGDFELMKKLIDMKGQVMEKLRNLRGF